MIRATFHPQAWQSGHAIDVDPQGETSWTVTPAYLESVQARVDRPERVLTDSTDESGLLCDDPAAPEWVRMWRGPYWVELEMGNDSTEEKSSVSPAQL